jgi:hypothetical protein
MTEYMLIILATIVVILQLSVSLSVAVLIAFIVLVHNVEFGGLLWFANFFLKTPVQINVLFTANFAYATAVIIAICTQIGWSFTKQHGLTRQNRAMKTLFSIGSSLTSGLIFVKLICAVLFALSPNTMMRIYLFRTQTVVLVLSILNGMILFPIMLSECGPKRVSYLEDSLSL